MIVKASAKFVIFHPAPGNAHKVACHPGSWQFDALGWYSLEFHNTTDVGVDVYLPPDLQPAENPLYVPPKGDASVNVWCTVAGVFPCDLVIVYQTCPGCGQTVHRRLLGHRPRLAATTVAVGAGEVETPLVFGDGEPYILQAQAEEDGDPVIIIKPV